MINRIFSSSIFGALLLIAFFSGCKKESPAPDNISAPNDWKVTEQEYQHALNSLTTEKDRHFFDISYASTHNKYIKSGTVIRDEEENKRVLEALIVEIIKQNNVSNITDMLFETIGNPIWDRSIFLENTSLENKPLVLLPFAKLTADSTLGFLIASPADSLWATRLYTRPQIDSLILANPTYANLPFLVTAFFNFDIEIFGKKDDRFKHYLEYGNFTGGAEDRCDGIFISGWLCADFAFTGDGVEDRDCTYFSDCIEIHIGHVSHGGGGGASSGGGGGSSSGGGSNGPYNNGYSFNPSTAFTAFWGDCQSGRIGDDVNGGITGTDITVCEQMMQLFAAGITSPQALEVLRNNDELRNRIIQFMNSNPDDDEIATVILNSYRQNLISLPQVSNLLALASNLDLSLAQIVWFINGNQDKIAETFNLASSEGFSADAASTTKMLVDLSAQYAYPGNANDAVYKTIVYQHFANLYDDPVTDFLALAIRFYTATEAAKLKYQHPDWSNWYCQWKATVSAFHVLLDVGGLFPVAGEICDLSNGVIYYTEGDWVNGSLSITAAVPIVGWFSTGAKYAEKIIGAGGALRKLSWVSDAAGKISFGSKQFLRTVINAPSGTQAHHLIPWEILDNPVIQSAAKRNSNTPWHMNSPVNGIALGPAQHLGSHPQYTTAVTDKLTYISQHYGLGPDICAQKSEELANKIRNILIQNPTKTVNHPDVIALINNIVL